MEMRVGTRQRQQGVALITAILITALVTVAAVAMATRQQLDIRRTGNQLEADQAYLYALGMEEWAKQVLRDDLRNSAIDTLQEDWHTQLPPIPVEGGSIQGSLEDMQGRFNLNNLLDDQDVNKTDVKQVEGIQRLLTQVSRAEEDINFSPFLANAVADWIDPNLNTLADGAEDLEYLGTRVPYRAANRFMVSTSELQAVAGFSPEGVRVLRDLVTALPAKTAVNVNTASEVVLMTLHQDITPSVAQAIAEYRTDTPFEKPEDFVDYMDKTHKIQLDAKGVAVESSYFAVTALAVIGRMEIELHSLLLRQGDKVSVLWRSIGVD